MERKDANVERTDAGTDPRAGVLPAAIRYPVIVVLVGIGLVCLVTVLYDAGWLPIAGPFAAVVIAGVIVYLVMWWRSRRLGRLAAAATSQLRELGPALARERDEAVTARPTGASDQSLEQAGLQVDTALQQLAWGHEQGAVAPILSLADHARRSWRPDVPLSRQVEELSRTATEMDQVIRRMLAAAARRQPRR